MIKKFKNKIKYVLFGIIAILIVFALAKIYIIKPTPTPTAIKTPVQNITETPTPFLPKKTATANMITTVVPTITATIFKTSPALPTRETPSTNPTKTMKYLNSTKIPKADYTKCDVRITNCIIFDR